jgi:type I restriction enzyme S subunit
VISRNSINGPFPKKKLGEVVEFLDSQRRPVTESERRPGPYPYYGANGQQGTIDGYIFDEPLVLLAEDGGHFTDPQRGIAYRISGKTWVNNHAHVLRPKADTDLAYLCRVLENYDVTPFITGTTRGKLTQAGAAEIVIPLPPLAEQRRIAEVLDWAEALRAKRRAALVELDSLTQSLFLDLFGDPATNPKGWPKVELGEVVKLVGGYAFKSEDFATEGNAVVRISNLTGDGIDLSDIARIPDDKLGKGVGFKIEPGEILIAMSGATTGKLGVVPLELSEDLYQNQRVGNYRIRAAARIQREFLLGLLRTSFYQRFLWQLAAGVAQPNVSGWQLESAVVPLPPIELQRDFAGRVTAVEKLKTAQRASLAELDALFATLQYRAFRGEL